MKALTLRRPWGWAIAHLGKDIENRSWRPYLEDGETFAVHSGKAWDEDAVRRERVRAAMQAATEADPFGEPWWHVEGIVGVARLVGAHRSGAACTPGCKPWGLPGGWHWQVAGTPLATPVPCKGALGLWDLPDDVEQAVRKQLAEVTAA